MMHWLLSFLIGPAAAGVLAACGSIANLANPILLGVGNYLAPRFAETVALHSRQTTIRLYWETTGLLMLGAGLFSGVAILFGSELLWLFYRDPAYAPFGAVVGLLAVRLILAIPTVAADHAVVAMESPRGSALATVVGLLTTIALSVPLISAYQVLGAAIALVIGTAVESVCLLWVFARRLRVWQWEQTDASTPAAVDGAVSAERTGAVADDRIPPESGCDDECLKAEPTP
jgi:O-antigen/teichoic acid export membrane protein